MSRNRVKKGRLSSVTIFWVLIFFSVFVVNMKQQTGAFVVVNSLALKSVGTFFYFPDAGLHLHARSEHNLSAVMRNTIGQHFNKAFIHTQTYFLGVPTVLRPVTVELYKTKRSSVANGIKLYNNNQISNLMLPVLFFCFFQILYTSVCRVYCTPDCHSQDTAS